jgi:Phage integrase, N-terminal SAM-like domain
MTDQVPAIIPPGVLATRTDTHLVPALIANLGDEAGWRYVEFFTANIRNPHTRRAYARACGQFFAWYEQRGLTLPAIRPHDVATYIEQLQAGGASAPSVKQQLAAVRMPAARFLIAAIGSLSAPTMPNMPGLGTSRIMT